MRKYRRFDLAAAVERSAPGSDFELSEETIEKLKTYTDVVVAVLKVSTIFTMMVVAPNAIQALTLFEKKRSGRKPKPKETRKRLIKTLYYLRREGSINFNVLKDGELEVVPTKKGRKRIEKLDLETISIRRPKKWDGKFWLVAGDIPTKKHRRGADALREKLKELSFCNLQKSMYFYPFDPRVEVEFIARMYGIASFITYMKIEHLEPSDKKALTAHFKEQGIL